MDASWPLDGAAASLSASASTSSTASVKLSSFGPSSAAFIEGPLELAVPFGNQGRAYDRGRAGKKFETTEDRSVACRMTCETFASRILGRLSTACPDALEEALFV